MSHTSKNLKKAARIILVGAPGVGKGTQSERLLSRFPGLASISSGDLLRENVRRRTPLGKFCPINNTQCWTTAHTIGPISNHLYRCSSRGRYAVR